MEVNPTILIIGCGKLGKKIGSNLKNLFNIVGIKRKSGDNFNDFKIIYLDIFDSILNKALIEVNPKYVIYSLAADEQSTLSYQNAYLKGLELCIESIKKNCSKFRHLFFISSTRVYGQKSNTVMTEATPPEPKDFGGRALLGGEEFLALSGTSATVLRLSGLYGDQRTSLIQMANDYTCWPKNRWTNRIHDEDVINFIVFLLGKLEQDILIEPLYLLTDNSPVSLYEVLNHIRVLLGLKALNIDSNNPFDGKQLMSIITPKTEFIFNYPSYQNGYKSIIHNLGK